MELAADGRAHPPVTLSVGPVLHPDDAVGNKMAALYGRALARDFLDIDAVLASGRYTSDELIRLVEAADPGFDVATLADVLGRIRPDQRGRVRSLWCRRSIRPRPAPAIRRLAEKLRQG